MKGKERIPENDKTEEMRAEEQKLPLFATQRGRMLSALLMFLILAVFSALFWSGKGGTITFQMDQEMLGIVCQNRDPVFVSYEDIRQVELIDGFETGTALEASDWDSGWCGVYENEEYGVYTLYAYSGTGEYIVVRYDGGVLVFNLKKTKDTQKTYRELLEVMG